MQKPSQVFTTDTRSIQSVSHGDTTVPCENTVVAVYVHHPTLYNFPISVFACIV